MIITRHKETGIKHCISENYNYRFDPRDGEFIRWGKTIDDDPKVGLLEIFDLEVSTECEGIGKGPCKHCYKSNTPRGENMSFDTFKNIFDKLPKTLTQIAFGIGDAWANPDLEKMFAYCRNNDHNPGVVPNVTTNGYGMTDEWVQMIATYCGGVAVSVYDPKDVCYDAVKRFVDAGIAQVNIHQLVAEETFELCKEVINDAATDPRLKGLKAIVFLTLKPKGKRNKHHIIKDVAKYRELVDLAFSKGISIGFDSCTAPIFLSAMKDHPMFEQFSQMVESCESSLFSLYANVRGEVFPCSFTEGEYGWRTGISLIDVTDFNREVWNSARLAVFRQANLETENTKICSDCRMCVTFPDLYDPSIENQNKDDSQRSYINSIRKYEPTGEFHGVRIVSQRVQK